MCRELRLGEWWRRRHAMALAAWAVGLAGPWLLAPSTAAATAPATAKKVQGLRLLQRRVGFQSTDQGEQKAALLQSLTVDIEGKRLFLEEYGSPSPLAIGAEESSGPEERKVRRRLIVRMDKDPPMIWEAFPFSRTYREHKGDLNRLQKERSTFEKQMIRQARSLDPDEAKELLGDNHLRSDGERIVDVRLEAGEVILGRQCDHLVVSENGRTILDAQVTKDVPGGGSYFRLYRRLGVFSDEVLEKIRDIDGVPLKAAITVVTALPVETVEVEVLHVDAVELTESDFEPPSGFVLIKAPKPLDFCAYCGAKVKTTSPAAKLLLPGGRWLYFDSEDHAEVFAEKHMVGRDVRPGTKLPVLGRGAKQSVKGPAPRQE